MATDVGICNVALTNIGALGNVISIAPPDGGAYAHHCARFFPIARDLVNEAAPWSFALTRKQLPLLVSDYSLDEFPYAYQIPSDCLRPLCVLPVGVTDERLALRFIVEGDVIFTTGDEIVLKYIKRVEELAKWTRHALDAVAWKLSYYLAGAIVKSDHGMKGSCAKAYESAIQLGMGTDANSGNMHGYRQEHIPAWMVDQ